MINKIYNYEDLIKIASSYMDQESINMLDVYYKEALSIHEGMKRKTGEDYIHHPVGVAYILAALKMDPMTVCSALIHEAIILEKRTAEDIENKFGSECASILSCLTKISNIKRTFNKESNIERDRRIIVGLAENPKALFIKLADRTHNMRTIDVFDKTHKDEIIEETEKIIIPIAHRLGIKKIKSELEDLCFRFSKPEVYAEIREKINAEDTELAFLLKQMQEEISDLLKDHDIEFEIFGRVKSTIGIYNKLVKGRRFSDIYDLLGLRILVEKTEECYFIIGLIHSKYKSIPKRFKDFISNPKSNMYQSVHTTVFGPDGRMFEIQVRTYEMDEVAEKGVASHWSYKEGTKGEAVKTSLENRLEKFRSLIEANDIENNEEFFSHLDEELAREEIYVFTPKGDIIELPSGATPIDFAYKIHSEVGNKTVGAIVNDNIVKLDHELNDGEVVKLLTKPGNEPNKDWLKFVKTDTAKNRIKSYFSKQEKDRLMAVGEELLANYLRKKKLPSAEILTEENLKKACTEIKVGSIDEVYLNIGSLKFTPAEIVEKILGEELKEKDILDKIINNDVKTNIKHTDFIIGGKGNIKSSLASCCYPVYGDEVVGYVTTGYGVKVHRKCCNNIPDKSDRIIDVSWSKENNERYISIINIYVDSTNDKLVDIVTSATKFNIVIESLRLRNKKNYSSYYEVNLKVKDVEDLKKFIDSLENLTFIESIER